MFFFEHLSARRALEVGGHAFERKHSQFGFFLKKKEGKVGRREIQGCAYRERHKILFFPFLFPNVEQRRGCSHCMSVFFFVGACYFGRVDR